MLAELYNKPFASGTFLDIAGQIISEYEDRLGRLISLLKAELDVSKGLPFQREIRFFYKIMTELFDGVSALESPTESDILDDLTLYEIATQNAIDLLLTNLRSRTIIPERTTRFIKELESFRKEHDRFVDHNKILYAPIDFEYDSDEYFFAGRTTTTTSSSPAPPMAPAVLSKPNTNHLRQPVQRPSVVSLSTL